jgi:hypothetical protein
VYGWVVVVPPSECLMHSSNYQTYVWYLYNNVWYLYNRYGWYQNP